MSRVIASLAIFVLGAGCPAKSEAPRHEEHGVEERGVEEHGVEEHGVEDHGHEEHGHEEHGHEGHLHPEIDFGPDALAQLVKVQCEHGVQILECNSCRFEAGAVDLAPALTDTEGDHLIRLARVAHSAEPRTIQLTGEVGFDERKVVHISPRIQGVARRVFVDLGDRVKVGTPLVEIDSLELGRLRSAYLQTTARLKLARDNSVREERLFEKRITSGSERQAAEAALAEARAAKNAAEEQLRLLGLSDGDLERLVAGGVDRGGRLSIRSTLAGEVVAKHAVQGERLVPEAEIFTVADLSTVWVWGNVYERDLAAVLAATKDQALPAAVTVASFPGQSFEGRVDYVGATMDEATRTVRARVSVANPERLLRPGMFAQVLLNLAGDGAAILVPSEAVVGDGDARFIFVRVGERRFLRRDVRIGGGSGGLTRITEGLRDGEEIVVRGAFLLKSDILREKMGAGCAD